jgi:transposase
MRAACQYETDVTDAQWDLLHRLLPRPTWTPGSRGRPPRPLRQVVNGMLYVHKPGCQWRMLSKEFGPWETVYGYFRRWRRARV